VGLGIALVVFAALNLWARHGDYFFYDEYEIVLHRYSLHDLLEPTNGHPVIIWLPIYYLMRPIFGLGSALPYEVVGILAMAAAACVLFAYLSRRAGRWVALAGTILILFIGSGSDLLFWSFQLAFAGSVATGLGALLALSSGHRHRDAIAAVLLVASAFFLAVGLAFVVAAAVAILVETGVRAWRPALRRLAVVIGPALVLFAIWYATFGHRSPSRSSFDNLISAPGFALEGIGASLAFLTGLAGDPKAGVAIGWGIALLVAVVGLGAWRVAAGRGIAPTVWIGVAGGVTFWLLTGINRPPDGTPDAGRYCFVGAIFALLVLAELVRGLRPTRVAVGLAAALVLISVLANLDGLRYGRNILRVQAQIVRADLGALEIARDQVDPRFALAPGISGSDFLIVVDARSYFKSRDRYGSPAFTPSEILEQGGRLRAEADAVLIAALPVALKPVSALPPSLSCRPIRDGGAAFRAAPGTIWLRGTGSAAAEVQIDRFGAVFKPAGVVEPGETAKLTIPPDRADRPWHVRIAGGSARVCR
jgi:hypothetical protein